MSIIKLNATDSTNAYLKELALSQPLEDFTIVSTELQLRGRGQMGSDWISEKGKNLTISVLKNLEQFPARNQFDLNCVVSLAIYSVLTELSVPNLSVKWPNDILSGNQKICGILIENILKGKFIQMAILGIGLNVNQMDFSDIERASSLKLILGSDLNLDELIDEILTKLKLYFKTPQKDLRAEYEKVLFRKDKPSTFENPTNEKFLGLIRGVNEAGKLVVELEDSVIKKFDLKEVKLLY
ncbi:biotin--[acetyl-CoA-carboxylase] ligase [uncultured Croceitalea sp.]|uniref:biotin--[acetyl-CoA-carboxylase] ligase n=1 Tax=uncultured Croceitalea sp. TaxID=1798908 RepID=UPI003305A92B